MKAYCLRVWPSGPAQPMPGAGRDFKTEDVFVALSAAFSYWCAESLSSPRADIPHQEFMLRSTLFNAYLGREMQRRNDDLRREATAHVKEIATLRARLARLERQERQGQHPGEPASACTTPTETVTPAKMMTPAKKRLFAHAPFEGSDTKAPKRDVS